MKTLKIYESDFNKVIPWWMCIPFMPYSLDVMTIGHYGCLEYGYNTIKDLPKRYRKLVKN